MRNPLNEGVPTTAHLTAGDGVQIRKGVPMPGRREQAPARANVGTGALTTYPWADLEVGDSFIARPIHHPAALRTAAYTAGCRMDRDFSVRELEDGTHGVWRAK